MDRPNTPSAHEFPPQRALASVPYLGSVRWLTVRRLGTLLALLILVIELLRLQDIGSTPIPFSYPLFVDVLLVYVTLYTLEGLHSQLDEAKVELMTLAQISDQRPNVPDNEVPEPDEIRATFEERFEWAFDPVRMIVSGVVLGAFVLLVMFGLGVLNVYPYVLMNFVFGFLHGMMLPAVLVCSRLLKIVPEEYINDLNGMDPAGVGGYPEVGKSIATAAWYGTVIINVDFVILGSVAFLNNSTFQTVVLAAYVAELALLFGYTLWGTFRIRNVLREVRDRRIRQLQWRFGRREGNFLADDPSIGQETDEMLEIVTYTILFERLNQMNLWPINVVWWTRFIGSVVATVLVILIQFVLVIDVSAVVGFVQ